MRLVRLIVYFLVCGLLVLSTSTLVFAEESIWGGFLPIDEFYTMLDPDGNVLLQTGRELYVEDQYLTSDNSLYEVVEINEEDRIARTKLVEKVELEIFPINSLRKELGLTVIEAAEDSGRGKIALYHTHNAESYVPTDGTDSIYGKGGIHQVGKVFAESLSDLGITVDYSEELHLPHDRGAYRRSRETVLELLAKSPDAIFDLHRDAAPKSAYAIQLQDEWMTQVHFVVGRQNQNLGVNRKYAQSLKAVADDMYPGLVKGIFYGRGNYNQDLSPLSLLLEAGAHTNSRSAAERGIRLFAEVVNHYFYGPAAEAAGHEQGGVASRSILGVLGFTASLSIAIYVINVGGFKPAWERTTALLRRRRLK